MIDPTLTGLDRLHAALAAIDLAAEIVHPGVPMPTVPLAAAAVGTSAEAIIKTVVFVDDQGHTIVAIANGTSRINRTLLATAIGVDKVRLADSVAVLERTGYPAGGVSPIGIRDEATRIVIDSGVLVQTDVYGGAGTEDDLIRLAVPDLVRVTRGLVADIVDSAV